MIIIIIKHTVPGLVDAVIAPPYHIRVHACRMCFVAPSYFPQYTRSGKQVSRNAMCDSDMIASAMGGGVVFAIITLVGYVDKQLNLDTKQTNTYIFAIGGL